MAYTPTTWNTGDTITASAMNKIEQGIADGGSKYPIVTVNITNQAQKQYFGFGYAKYEGGEFIAVEVYSTTYDAGNYWKSAMYGVNNTGSRTVKFVSPFPVSEEENIYLVFYPPYGSTCSNFSGDINSQRIAVFFGSTDYGYRITGDCSLNCYT